MKYKYALGSLVSSGVVLKFLIFRFMPSPLLDGAQLLKAYGLCYVVIIGSPIGGIFAASFENMGSLELISVLLGLVEIEWGQTCTFYTKGDEVVSGLLKDVSS